MSTPSNFGPKKRYRNATAVTVPRRNLTTSTNVNQVNRFTLRRVLPFSYTAPTTYARTTILGRDFTSANFTDYSGLAELYSQYRVRWMKLTLIPNTVFYGNAGGGDVALVNTGGGPVYTVALNTASAEDITTADQILQYDNCRYRNIASSYKHTAFWRNDFKGSNGDWLDFGGPAAPADRGQCTILYPMDDTTNLASFKFGDVIVEFCIECKQRS